MKENTDIEKVIVHEILGHEDSEDVFTKEAIVGDKDTE